MNRLSIAERAKILGCLVEGNSIRATCRLTGAAKGTVLKLLADVGAACARFHNDVMLNLPCQRSDGSPWRSQCVGTADGRTVAEVCIPKGGGWEHPEALANARLIASAPELLEALEELRAQLREHVKFDVKRHYSLMVADAAAGTAIAKARGE